MTRSRTSRALGIAALAALTVALAAAPAMAQSDDDRPRANQPADAPDGDDTQTGDSTADATTADATTGDAPADDAVAGRYARIIKAANAAYNAGDYAAARDRYIEAIQLRPDLAAPYRSLARAYFWLQQYSPATAYYDVYLRQAPEADDAGQVASERRLASSRAGDTPWTPPEAQQLALAALQKELEDGRAFTRGGGGAWGLYRTLLRTGYAQPALARLRRELARRLVDEFEALATPTHDGPVPRLDLEDWQLQMERLEAIRQLHPDARIRETVARRSALGEAAIAILTGRGDEAVALARAAIAKNPDMAYAGWLEVTSLLATGADEAALDAVEQLSRRLADVAPGQLGYARILRAIVLQRLGRTDDAADVYYDVLRR